MMIDYWVKKYNNKFISSQNIFEKALTNTAGGVGHDLRYTLPFPRYIKRAKGSKIWDVDGNEFIDYGMGNGACFLGHSDPDVLDAVEKTLKDGLHFGHDHPAQVEWAGLIQKMIPSAEKVRFVNSGSEGSMLALRLARAFTGKNKLVRFEGHFSGWHDYVGKGAMYPFNESVSPGIPQSTLDTIIVLPADINQLEDCLHENTDIAAVMLEPSGGSWGRVPLTKEFNQQLRELTTKYGIMLIFDEVITGFRSSTGGYQKLTGITPDISVLGKIISGGLPGGAVVGLNKIMELFDYNGDSHHDRYERIHHLGTFNANPLSCAAGIVTLKKIATGEPHVRANEIAEMIRNSMNSILDEESVAGYAYGDTSCLHLYLEKSKVSDKKDRNLLHTNDPEKLKCIPEVIVRNYQKNLHLRGIDILSYTGGVTSSMHSYEDVDKTIKVFQEVIREMKNMKILY
jgi:glutamate-1-semialdehyde 2,1-aminomutase